MDPPTPLSLPATLPYPITISRLLISPGSEITRGTRLLEFSFTSDTSRRVLERARRRVEEGKAGKAEGEDEARENDMVGSWESPVDGTLVEWEDAAKAGTKVEKRHAHRPWVKVQQACTHPVQLHGLCGICGKELAETDYLAPGRGDENPSGPSNYLGGFEMSHDALGVTVSTDEARRLDTQTRETLLSERKLSLIVDLDQTIIHTTVDPTVGEWMAEIREESAGETEQSGQEAAAVRKKQGPEGSPVEGVTGPQDETTTPPSTPPIKAGELPDGVKPVKEPNPNAEALRDVARFQLEDDLPPGTNPRFRMKAAGRWYYTKPRPGLQPFLAEMSRFYEMHVYTMGTRSYADAICDVIDPDGKIFGGRVLSRDESGSFSSKNLKRLFPTDQSMVVVIDDRSDVWGDIPNLVKVVPYDFFVGIGDINSSFLPPKPSPPPGVTLPDGPPVRDMSGDIASPTSVSSDGSTPPPTTPGESDEDSLLRQAKLLDEVSEARPLKKLQEELEAEEMAEEQTATSGVITGSAESGSTKPPSDTFAPATEQAAATHPKHRKPLLNAYDEELLRIAGILTEIHASFYRAYDERDPSRSSKVLPMGCDVELILPDLKSRVLEGCQIVFSGVIPRHIRPEESEPWLTAETFGALVSTNITPSTTHCVTATPGTEKTYRAQKAGAKVVWMEWFLRSVALWTKMEERPFLVIKSGASSAAGTGSGVGSRAGSKPGSGTVTPMVIDGEGGPATAAASKGAQVRSTSGAVAPPSATTDGVAPRGGDNIEAKTRQSPGSSAEPGAAADSGVEDIQDGTAGPEEAGAEGEEGEVEEDDPGFDLGGWGDDADEEWKAFMEGGSEAGTEDLELRSDAGSSRAPSPPESRPGTPGTPRKRVRYADEEHLPLESFREPDPKALLAQARNSLSGADEHGEGEGDENGPPRKRRALLLPAPEPGEGVPEANRFVWKGKGKAWDQAGAAGVAGAVPPDALREDEGKSEMVGGGPGNVADGEGVAEDEGADEGADEGTERSTEAGSEAGGDDDEFAKLLLESLDHDEGGTE